MGKGTTTTTEEKFTTTITFNVTDYGRAVLVEVRPSGRFCAVGKNTIVFDGPTFRRMQRQSKDATWILRTKDTCRMVTPEYYACYVSGGLPRSVDFNDANKRLAKDPRVVLENGDFHLAIRDSHGYDHNFYDLSGKAIPRPIRVDYIFGHLHGSQEAMELVAEKLRTHEQVTEVTVSRILDDDDRYDAPWATAATARYGIEYLFTPTPRQFAKWGPGSKGYEYNAMYARIRKLVKCGAVDAYYVVANGKAVTVKDN